MMFKGYFHPFLSVGKTGLRDAKLPLLIVGTNTYLSQNFGISGSKSAYLFFCPTGEARWQIASVIQPQASERIITSTLAEGTVISKVISDAMRTKERVQVEMSEKLYAWAIKTTYRCGKISLRDVLHLEDYR